MPKRVVNSGHKAVRSAAVTGGTLSRKRRGAGEREGDAAMSYMSPPPPGARREELPPDDTVRWVPSRKAAVLAAITDGQISEEEACRRWRLSLEELGLWRRAMQQVGVHGLRVTRIQVYRPLIDES